MCKKRQKVLEISVLCGSVKLVQKMTQSLQFCCSYTSLK